MQSTYNIGANIQAINGIGIPTLCRNCASFFCPFSLLRYAAHMFVRFSPHVLITASTCLLFLSHLLICCISLCTFKLSSYLNFTSLHRSMLNFCYLHSTSSQFIAGASRLGKLDTSLENSVDLPANTRIPLPLWLASRVAARLPLLVEIPSTFGRQAQNELRAGSVHVNLSSRSTYFYELGLKLAIVFLFNNISASHDILSMLQKTLTQRSFTLIATRNSSGSIGKDMNVINFIQSLTELEKVIFLLKESARANYAAMRRGQSSILKTSQAVLLANQRKRKAGT